MSKEEDKEAKEKVRHYLVNVLVGHQTGINKLYQPLFATTSRVKSISFGL